MLQSSILYGALLALARVALASQPGAVQPVAAPMRDLPWGQLNFLHTTDTHGWLGGHPRESQFTADWGDYYSFTHHMRRRAHRQKADLLVIDSGDRIEGSGLYDASIPKGRYQYPIFAQQDVDILTIGNHELYKAYSATREHNTTIPNFGDHYLASNVNYTDPATGRSAVLGQRYRRFKTKIHAIDVVAFGFLFNFDGNANNTHVQPVEETINEAWFQEAMRLKPDLFVVVAHIGLRMPELRAIFTALRKQNWHIPIVFFGGHVHVRDALSFDSQAFAVASGRYLETIGWMSIDGIRPKAKTAELNESGDGAASLSTAASLTFGRKYIDNNLLGMYHHTGLNASTFPTDAGRHISEMITKAREKMRLDKQIGCAPRDLWMTRAEFPSNASIYSWLRDEVLPDVVVNETRRNKPRLAIINTGGVRSDIHSGPFTQDTTLSVNPFANAFRYVPDVPYAVARKVLGILNSADKVLSVIGPDARHMAVPHAWSSPHSSSQSSPSSPSSPSAASPRLELRSNPTPHGQKPALTPGYTTKDDLGDDGDDAEHSPIPTHAIPNCIQAEIAFPPAGKEPATVDVVFDDFIQPWILPALKFSGGDVDAGNVRAYTDETLAHMMVEWVRRNWKGDC